MIEKFKKRYAYARENGISTYGSFLYALPEWALVVLSILIGAGLAWVISG